MAGPEEKVNNDWSAVGKLFEPNPNRVSPLPYDTPYDDTEVVGIKDSLENGGDVPPTDEKADVGAVHAPAPVDEEEQGNKPKKKVLWASVSRQSSTTNNDDGGGDDDDDDDDNSDYNSDDDEKYHYFEDGRRVLKSRMRARSVFAGLNFVGILRKDLEETYKLFGHHEESTKSGHKQEAHPHDHSNEHAMPWYIFKPDTLFRRVWDITQAFVLLYLAIVVPLRVGYDVAPKGFAFAVEFFVDLYFYIDILLNFITAIENADTGEVISDTRTIRAQYMRSWFAIDVLACLPIDLAINIKQGTFVCSWSSCDGKKVDSSASLVRIIRILRLTRLFKLLRLTRMRRLFERYQNDLFQLLPIISIFRHVFILMFLGHFFGCFFYYFSSPDYWTESETELINSGVKYEWIKGMFGGTDMVNEHATEATCSFPYSWNADETRELGGECRTLYGLMDRYVASIYWAFTTMTTVGYGDISASTQGERVFAIIGMIAGGIVFSEIISNMSHVIAQLDSTRAKYKAHIEQVQAFIRDHNLPSATRLALLAFFRRQEVRSYDSKTLLSEVPVGLRKDILVHMYADLTAKCPLLAGQNVDSAYITDVCDVLYPYNCTANTYIYNRGEIGSDVFIMKHGLAFVLDIDREKRLGKLTSGDVFGETALLSSMLKNYYFSLEKVRRQENVKSMTPCSMLRMSGKDVAELLKKHDTFRLKIDTIYRVNSVRFESKLSGLLQKSLKTMFNYGGHDAASQFRMLGRQVRNHCVEAAAAGQGLSDWYDPDEAKETNRLRSQRLHHPSHVNPFDHLEIRYMISDVARNLKSLKSEVKNLNGMYNHIQMLRTERKANFTERKASSKHLTAGLSPQGGRGETPPGKKLSDEDGTA
ncbi:potassium voltage-gated channel [Pseudoscourfieldia marina]